jgi:hypothetical protein
MYRYCKSAFSGPADFATNRIPIRIFFVAYSVWCLRTVHVPMTILQAANVSALVFTANCHISLFHHIFCTFFRNPSFGEIGSFGTVTFWGRGLALHGKTVPNKPKWKSNINFMLVYCTYNRNTVYIQYTACLTGPNVVDQDPSQVGSESFRPDQDP